MFGKGLGKETGQQRNGQLGSFLDQLVLNRLAVRALADFIEEFPSAPGAAEDYIKNKFPLLPKISVDYAIMEKAALPAVEITVPLVVEARAADNWDAAH